MYLLIDTAKENDFYLGLIDASGNFLGEAMISGRYTQAEKIIPAINQLLFDTNSGLAKLKGITVVTGPGPFTALRIGIATANTLGWALKIPVLGVKAKDFKNTKKLAQITVVKMNKVKPNNIVEPFYGKEPNITVKSRSGLSHQ